MFVEIWSQYFDHQNIKNFPYTFKCGVFFNASI